MIQVPAWFVGGLVVLIVLHTVIVSALDIRRWRRVKRDLAEHGVKL